jgi:hypothetical protein
MLKIDAEREAIRRWRELPRAERKTDEQAAAFAMKIKDEIPFESSRDPYQVVKGWLRRDLELRGGL